MSGINAILNDLSFNAGVVEVFEPLESDDLSRFEGEGGSQAPERAAEWVNFCLNMASGEDSAKQPTKQILQTHKKERQI